MVRRQQQKSEQTRKELENSAYKLFLEKGYDRTTIAEITSAAGYATGSFYRHWKEKEELFNQIQDEFIEYFKTLNKKAIEKIASFEDIVNLLISNFDQLTNNQITLRLFIEMPKGVKEGLFLPRINDILEYCTSLLAEKINFLSEGQRTDCGSYQTASLLYSFLSGYIVLKSVNIEISPIETLKSAFLAILQNTT